MKFRRIVSILILSAGFLCAQVEQPYPPLSLVSIPTAGTMPKGTFTLETLLQKNGGIQPKLAVGLTNHFTIGISYGVQKFIGNSESRLNKHTPEVQLKYRVFSENTSWPALVLGLDTQGRGEYHDEETLSDADDGILRDDPEEIMINRYDQKAWGVYLVASKNWNVLGNLGVHIGICKNNWENKDEDDEINLFFGFDKELNRSFSLLLEYDAALNDNEERYDFDEITFGKDKGYLNAGLRWSIAKNLMIELNVNNIMKNNEGIEYTTREVKIMYSESF